MLIFENVTTFPHSAIVYCVLASQNFLNRLRLTTEFVWSSYLTFFTAQPSELFTFTLVPYTTYIKPVAITALQQLTIIVIKISTISMAFSALRLLIFFVLICAAVSLPQDPPATLAIATYDYVVVGCGIAGLVVSMRLSENETVSIICLEAGSL